MHPSELTDLGADPHPDLAPFVAELQALTHTDLAAGGLCTGGPRMRLTALCGTRTDSLRDLDIRPGHGLGGKVLALDRPMWVADYSAAKGITHHYDGPVRTEGLRAMVAVPFRVPGGARGVMYCAMRRAMPMGDRTLDRAAGVARRLEAEAAVQAEVNRRLADLLPATGRHGGSARDQCLRDVHAELRLLRDLVGDGARPRVEALLARIGTAMDSEPAGSAHPATLPRLTPRELDVLVQVATGATNADIADRLGLTPATVKSYLQTATRKLDARNRVEAVANARRFGLLL